ncbi:L-lactate permease [Catalinimonas sp. 4WD22]|uniref:L-lactate permease n=1 Tax=Catalinimonas locisalis TaxID=3133978 RepID=UPI003100CF0D
MIYFFSILPILLLVVVSLIKGVKEAVMTAFVVTILLFFYWGAGITHFIGTLTVSLITTLNILMIVFGAAFLYNIMDNCGLIKRITHSIDELHPSKEIRFFLIAICLTSFFEGVAGFGTPGAIVPLLLISMGFDAVFSVAVVLLFDGLFALFGAVGTPLKIGMQLPLQLSDAQVNLIGTISAVIGVLMMAVLLLIIFQMFRKTHYPLQYKSKIFVLYLFFALPFCVFAYLITDMATILASLLMLVLSVFYLKPKAVKIDYQPWLPYVFLAFLLILPKFFMPLSRWIGWDITFINLFDTGIETIFKPLQSPMIPFIIVGLGVAWFYKNKNLQANIALKKSLTVFVVLFPSIAVAQLMIYSGVEQPSMISYIAQMLGNLGELYPAFAPLIGVIGAFITGSTTISNIVFAPSQLETAQLIGLDTEVILSQQLIGASLGNAVSLFNIIAAAAIANLQNYKAVLQKTLFPVLAGALLVAIMGMALMGWM